MITWIIGVLLMYGYYDLWKEHQKVIQGKEEEIMLPIQKERSLTKQINDYLTQQNIPLDQISIYVKDLCGEEEVQWRTQTYMIAASIYKLPLAMLYYDELAKGTFQLNDTILYEAYCYEAGGPIADQIEPGSLLTIETLLHDMILYSDNTAGHILFEHMGGWIAFKQACVKYSNMEYEDVFFSGDNVLNTQYVMDTLCYLYEHRDRYEMLLTDMKQALPNDYLNRNLPSKTAQKYGYYENALHSAGIVEAPHPYAIVIFTQLGLDARAYLGDLNKICYDYFQKTTITAS